MSTSSAVAWLSRARPSGLGVLVTLLAVVVALSASATLVEVTGFSAVDSIHALYTGSIASQSSWTRTLLYTAVLLIVAVGSCIGARAGVFNIGQEGQVLMGALGAVWVSVRLALPAPLIVVVAVLAAAALGGGWAAISALMHRVRGVNIVVSTLLMSFVAQQVVSFAVNHQWFLQHRPVGTGATNPWSDQIAVDRLLPSWGTAPGLLVNLSLVLALVGAVGAAYVLTRTVWGFRLKLLGLNPQAARHAGVRVAAVSGLALAVSGAFAGIAGAAIVTTPIANYRLQDGVSSNVGWDGLLVALVARNNPLLAVPTALLFGILRSGGNFLAATGVPPFVVDVVKSLLVLAFVAPAAILRLLGERRRRTPSARLVVPTPSALDGAAA